jgi:hypothetical protein
MIHCPCSPPTWQVETCGGTICRQDGQIFPWTLSGNYVLRPIGGGTETYVPFSFPEHVYEPTECYTPFYSVDPACPIAYEIVRIEWSSTVKASHYGMEFNYCDTACEIPPEPHHFYDFNGPNAVTCTLGQQPSSVRQFHVKINVQASATTYVDQALANGCPGPGGPGNVMTMDCGSSQGSAGQGVNCGVYTYGSTGPAQSPVIAKVGSTEYTLRGWRQANSNVYHFVIDGYDGRLGGGTVDSYRVARVVTDSRGVHHCIAGGTYPDCSDPTATTYCELLGIYRLWIQPRVWTAPYGSVLLSWTPNQSCAAGMAQYGSELTLTFGQRNTKVLVDECGLLSYSGSGYPWLARYRCVEWGNYPGCDYGDYSHRFIMVLNSGELGQPTEVQGTAKDQPGCATWLLKRLPGTCTVNHRCGFAVDACNQSTQPTFNPNSDIEELIYMSNDVCSG